MSYLKHDFTGEDGYFKVETLPRGFPLPLDQTASSERHWRGRLLESRTNKWAQKFTAKDAMVDAFPDTKPKTTNDVTRFVVLSPSYPAAPPPTAPPGLG